MVTGFRAALDAGYDVVIKMDADGQMDAQQLPALVRPIELGMAEYVKGNRFRLHRPSPVHARHQMVRERGALVSHQGRQRLLACVRSPVWLRSHHRAHPAPAQISTGSPATTSSRTTCSSGST